MIKKTIIFVKGLFMGTADVMPGVSGGTIALVLGIYLSFVEAIKSLNLRWIPGLGRWILSGFKREAWQGVRDPLLAIHWGFLIPLALGMGTAIVLSSRIIPHLIDAHFEVMHGLFMGLVLGSIFVPWSQLERRSWRELLIILVIAAGTYLMMGASASPPLTERTVSVSEELSLGALTRAFPSEHDPLTLYCSLGRAPDNIVLRDAVGIHAAETHSLLAAICRNIERAAGDAVATARIIQFYQLDNPELNPFHQVTVPANTEVRLASPTLWYLFLTGLIAICAMLLPGISGSFTLLILGTYTFVFASLRSFIDLLIGQGHSLAPFWFLVVFGLGVLAGMMSFGHVISWLFKHHLNATLAAMIGLMLGSLRVLWPFKLGALHGGVVQNIAPPPGAPILASVLACLGGLVFVVGLSLLARRIDAKVDAAA